MKKLTFTILFCLFLTATFAQTTLLTTSFEGPGFDKGWTMGVSQGIELEPQDYPATGLDPWEKWDITETTSFGYVHSGDSAAWIGGTMYQETTHDWLMTPPIPIPEIGETTLYYWLWYHSEQMYVNKFYIMIYDVDKSSWEQAYLLANDFNSPYHYTEEYKLSLNPWKGKKIMLAFVKNGTYQMAMDDIRILNYDGDYIKDNEYVSGMKIYPNPASDCLKIELQEITNENLSIVDVTGKIVLSETITSNNVEINISCLDSGFYIVKIGDYIEKLFVK